MPRSNKIHRALHIKQPVIVFGHFSTLSHQLLNVQWQQTDVTQHSDTHSVPVQEISVDKHVTSALLTSTTHSTILSYSLQ